MDKKQIRECFKNHTVTFEDKGNVKIINFQEPGTNIYRIRFLFDEEYYQLHISGDLGNLTAINCDNMTFKKFGKSFVHSPGYFEEKIVCCDRPLYYYDEDMAKNDLKELIDRHEQMDNLRKDYAYTTQDFYNMSDDEVFEKFFDDVYQDFDHRYGIGSKGKEIVDKYVSSCYNYDFGKKPTSIIQMCLTAFEMAEELLRNGGVIDEFNELLIKVK